LPGIGIGIGIGTGTDTDTDTGISPAWPSAMDYPVAGELMATHRPMHRPQVGRGRQKRDMFR
jgi:hypothetical protein